MANRTDPSTRTVRGGNPQSLVSKIIRNKIHNSVYWKEQCFGLSSETIVDKAANLDYVGGTYGGNRKPCAFLCLLLKLLQIGPGEDIVEAFLEQEDLKYLRVLAAFYVRLTASAVKVYEKLEPLLDSYEKLRVRKADGSVGITYIDEFVDSLLRDKVVFDIDLPLIPKRYILEEDPLTPLDKRISLMQEEFDAQVALLDS